MHWIKVTRPQYEQSRRYDGMIGEVVGHFGPENSADAQTGYMVEFPDGQIIGLTDEEIEMVDRPEKTALP